MKYDVRCDNCGHIDTVNHSISEDHPPCVKCNGVLKTYFPLGTKLTNTQFKGSGWADEGRGGTR